MEIRVIDSDDVLVRFYGCFYVCMYGTATTTSGPDNGTIHTRLREGTASGEKLRDEDHIPE